jgi:hypothetical protein
MDSHYSVDTTANASLTNIFGVLGAEFSDLSQSMQDLQTVLSPALLQVAHDAACHAKAQQLDLMWQRLQALATFVSALEGLVPDSWRLDFEPALRGLTLSDLAWRLRGHVPPNEDHEAGLVEMF